MLTRVFLGWNSPFVGEAAGWLLSQPAALADTLVIVPTSQAGRQLRQQMARQQKSLLAPKIMTPGALLRSSDPDIASRWVERVAWQEVLERQSTWSPDLFPNAPLQEGEWAGGLANEMLKLRRDLQENGLTFFNASRMLASSIEAGRWQALAELERQMEETLRSWGYRSRSRVLADGVSQPPGIDHIVLAGITEIPSLLTRSLVDWQGSMHALVGAPETEAAKFSETGIPLDAWSQESIPWPMPEQGNVHLTADTREQAKQALHAVADASTHAQELAIGTADTESGDAIKDTFTHAGWIAYHPASAPTISGLKRWFKTWSAWLQEPRLATMLDLLAHPETEALIPNNRANLAESLAKLRNESMVMLPGDLRHCIQHGHFTRDDHKGMASSVIKAAETLEQWRAMCLRNDFTEPLERLLTALQNSNEQTADEALELAAWLQSAKPLIQKLKRPAKFWIELMLSDLPPEPMPPPDGRVIDIQGWLELFFEPGKHLVLCGLNEGKVPATQGGDPWLGESARSFLGLTSDAQRAARDAYLLRAMIEARSECGRVDLICAKAKPNGEPMLPSRLLLATDKHELPMRVQHLFRDIEPPDAKLRWTADWKWQPPSAETPERLNVTSFRDYLACPFRFYLKNILRMRDNEPDRVEWSARDFGNAAHQILELWGKNPQARDSTDADEIHQWLSDELDRLIITWFGDRVPLAVRIQSESLRQRLRWFARIQAQQREDGWEILHTEHKFEIQSGPFTIRGVIDRIDRHTESNDWRVIDYKTGKDDSVVPAHQTKITANTQLAAHIDPESPAVYTKTQNVKSPQEVRWTNLQLPLYSFATQQEHGVLATPCYFFLGETEAKVKIDPWKNFEQEDVDAAKACADWIAQQIHHGVFTPPAEKVKYDDLKTLAAGRPIEEVFEMSGMTQELERT